tara:strand:+ start:82015 stop:83313 length:1299 start_codon:yes stop_codon:yes gene_type:complete
MTRIFNIKNTKSMSQFFDLQKERGASFSDVSNTVASIINNIKERGDTALIEYTNTYDQNNLKIDNLKIELNQYEDLLKDCDKELYDALVFAHKRIYDYHKQLLPKNSIYKDNIDTDIELRWNAIDSVGIYVPGGRAIYPSSVLMNAIPAIVAGVKRIVMASPSINGVANQAIIIAAKICGINEFYQIGGAQAIASLAYGTNTIDKVDMIVGPGNSYVAAAKKQVFGDVGIDMLAGPSEVVIVADSSIKSDWVIEDLFAQAEHDINAQSILITKDHNFASEVEIKINQRINKIDNDSIMKKSWKKFGCIIICDDDSEIINLVNEIAPEHLQLCTKNAKYLSNHISNAGAIFIGEYTPEAIGDYVVGTNHVLPTLRTAKFSSGLSVIDFMKRTSIVSCNKNNFNKIAPEAIKIADAEGLVAHAKSLKVRLKDGK